ncbi:MAG TPA: hypothetical protein VFQ65_04570 [Kofleriaceae bacterium]|nr:hypothetical protein [Kofleriaceae bacterium]
MMWDVGGRAAAPAAAAGAALLGRGRPPLVVVTAIPAYGNWGVSGVAWAYGLLGARSTD